MARATRSSGAALPEDWTTTASATFPLRRWAQRMQTPGTPRCAVAAGASWGAGAEAVRSPANSRAIMGFPRRPSSGSVPRGDHHVVDIGVLALAPAIRQQIVGQAVGTR